MNNEILEPLIEQHRKEKDESIKFKLRRFEQWDQNYYLFRDKIITNRLTQRQAVNIPIMRESVQTWISKNDEKPEIVFETRGQGNDAKDKELVLNEMWAYYEDKLKLDLLDNMEKKIVGLQGRGFKKWGWSANEIFCDLIDPYDIDIDPRANPLDLDSADWVIHKNIFKPLRNILANKDYDATTKNQLKQYLDSKDGILLAAKSQEEFDRRNQRLQTLGVSNFDDYCASDLMVEINESYKMIWHEDEKQFVRHLIVIAADSIILVNKPLKEAIGISRLPIVSWASDPDLNDIWSDGVGDNVRTFNKIVNTYISQDIENRTYRNFGMYFFDTMNGKFTPRSFTAKPFGMYGVPGDPNKVVKQMQIEPLNDTSQQISFLKELIQSSVAQTPTEQGVNSTQGKQTLGEIQILFQQSQTRNEVVSKNYRKAWKESGEIFYELLNANSSGQFTLYKKSGNGTYQAKTITDIAWKNPAGYECKVELKAEEAKENDMSMKKLGFISQAFQSNPVAQKIVKRKQLEMLDWSQDEIDQVMQYEDQPQQQMLPPGQGQVPSPIQNLPTNTPVKA